MSYLDITDSGVMAWRIYGENRHWNKTKSISVQPFWSNIRDEFSQS